MNEMITPLHHKIYTLRGKQVMLDFDLAELYHVETRRLNEQVKRNSERFPDDFIFQLSESEYENLRSQFATSSLEEHGGRRKFPYAFTEKNDKKFKEVFKILDTLVFETRQTDEKVMGFLKP